jgi:hypothetical protein
LAGEVKDFAATPIENGFDHEQAKTLDLVDGNRRRHWKVPGGSRSLQQGRPVMTSASSMYGLIWSDVSALTPRIPAASDVFGKIGLHGRVPKSGMPAVFISNSTKANELLLKTINFTGNFN